MTLKNTVNSLAVCCVSTVISSCFGALIWICHFLRKIYVDHTYCRWIYQRQYAKARPREGLSQRYHYDARWYIVNTRFNCRSRESLRNLKLALVVFLASPSTSATDALY